MRDVAQPSINGSLSRAFSRLGWIGFWLQLAVGTIPVALLFYAALFDGSNGVVAIAQLRRRLRRNIPAIVITADRSAHVREDATSEAAHLLNKPIKPASLRALMTQWQVHRVAGE